MAIYNITETAYAGLQVAQAGMLVTSQNVTGSSVAGFTRRNANTVMDALAPNSLQLNGTSFAVDGFTREYSSLVGAQMLSQQAKSSYSDTLVQYTSPLNSLVSDQNTGLTSSLSTFFNAMGTYAADPTSMPAASAITAASNDVANRMAGMSAIVSNLKSQAQSGLGDTITQVNTLLPELASINHQITNATNPGNGAPSADLLDERDRILSSLQKLVGGQSLINGDGTATQLVNGIPLVERSISNKLLISNDKTKISVQFNSKDSIGNPNLQPEASISGGQAGALLNVINNFVPSIEQRLNSLAIGLVKVVNQAGQPASGLPTKLPIFGFKVDSNIYSSLSGGDLTSSIPDITSMQDLQNLYSGLANAVSADSTLKYGALPGTANSQITSIVAQPSAARGVYTFSQGIGANSNQVTLAVTLNGNTTSQTATVANSALGASQTLNFDKLGIAVTLANPIAYAVPTDSGLSSGSNPGSANTNIDTIVVSGNATQGTYSLSQGTGNQNNQLSMSGLVNGSLVTQTLTLAQGSQSLNFDKFGISIPLKNYSQDAASKIAADIATAGSISVSAGNFNIPTSSGLKGGNLLTSYTSVASDGITLSTSASTGTYSFTTDHAGNLTLSGTYNGTAMTQTVALPQNFNTGTNTLNFSQFGISINLKSTAVDNGIDIANAMAIQPNSKVTVAPSLDTATTLAHALAGNGASGLTIDVSGAANDLQNYGLTAANFISVAPNDPSMYMNGSTPIINSVTANAVSKMGNIFGDSVASLTSDVGNQVATWNNTQKSDTAVLNNLTTQFNSISGVNLDEEAANLLKYQQLYAASSKVLQTGNQMFSALLAIMN